MTSAPKTWIRSALIFLLAGCGASPAPEAASIGDRAKIAAAPGAPAAPGEPVKGEPGPALDPVPAPESEIASAREPEIASDAARAANPLRLALPGDTAFLEAPMPPADPGRYVNWKERDRIRVGQSHLQNAEIVDGGRAVLVMSAMENAVRVYERKTGRLERAIPIEGADAYGRSDIAVWPDDGERPGFLAARTDGLWLYGLSPDASPRRLDDAAMWGLRWSPDERILAGVASDTGTQTSVLHFYRRDGAGSLEKLAAIPFAERVDGFDLSRDNRYLAVIYYPSNTVELIDLREGRALWRVPTPDYAGDVSLSPDGRAVAVAGAGLLLVDAAHPTRRALFSRFGNNAGEVRFSPSGDAVMTSSYDGKVRIFRWSLDPVSLSLVKTLSHGGTANVYSLRFFDGGDGLMSSSGDRTVRFWGGPTRQRPFRGDPVFFRPFEFTEESAAVESPARFDWAALSPGERRETLAELYATPRHHPSRLDGPPSPSRIRPGRYACRVGQGYRLRDCEVAVDPNGHAVLEVGEGNLIPMRGVLFDDGDVVRFEGYPTDARPFSCFGCQERCFLDPGSCGCAPDPPDRVRSCVGQPVLGAFRKEGAKWRGVVTYSGYHDAMSPPSPPPADFRFEEGVAQYTIELVPRR